MSSIIDETLNQLRERGEHLDASIHDLERKLDTARAAKALNDREISEMEKAVERLAKPAPARRSSGAGRSRPHARREPRSDSLTGKVLEILRSTEGTMNLGPLGSRADAPAGSVRSALGDLVERGYVRRVDEGVYEAIRQS